MRIAARYFLLTVLTGCAHDSSHKTSEKFHQPVVAIQPLDDFDNGTIKFLSEEITRFYTCRVIVLKQKNIPKKFFNNSKSPRYSADSLLVFLKQETNDSISYVLGLTGEDIFTTKKDNRGNTKKPEEKYEIWGIFGFGYEPGRSCVVSNFRLHCNNKEQELRRLKNITLHELGHNFGLAHCTNKNCIMTDANESIKTIDNESNRLCENCRKQIGRLCN